jgi:signal recognition particle subunit SRP54
VLMLGLQGSGKTTTSAKLARWLAAQGKHPMLVSTDVRRPAAIQQLSVLAKQVGVRVHDPAGELDPVVRATGALAATKQLGFDTLIVDTAGRLHIDDELMAELDAIAAAVNPTDRLYVADAMTGQDAVRSAGEFNARSGVSGVVLTKLDGDARGGAALSVVGVVGVPIAFVGVGERPQDFEPFHADRLVSRLLGMGDILTLIERAEEALDDESREKLESKTRLDDFTLEDFGDQLKTIKKMGPLDQVLGMIPGMGAIKELNAQRANMDGKQVERVQAIISSMTKEERANHQVINGSRRKRIARGSGTSVEEVNRVLKQFVEMRKMLKTMAGAGGGMKGKQRLMNMLRGR